MNPPRSPRDAERQHSKLLAATAVASAAVLVLLARTTPLTETAGRGLLAASWLALSLPLLAAAAWVLLGLWREAEPPQAGPTSSTWRRLATLACLAFALYIASSVSNRLGFAYLARLTLSPGANSYFQTAGATGSLWELLRDYETKMPAFVSHTQTQGAGPVVVYGLLRRCFAALPTTAPAAEALFALHPGSTPDALAERFSKSLRYSISADDVSVALLCSMSVAFLGALGLIPAYFLGAALGGRRAGTVAAGFYYLTPGMTLYTGFVDQVYPALTALILLCWLRALPAQQSNDGRTRWVWALCAGLLLVVAIFLSLGLLAFWMLVVLVAVTAAFLVGRSDQRRLGLAQFWQPLALVIAVPLIAFAILRVSAGYDLLAVCRTSDALRMYGYEVLWGCPYWHYVWANWVEAGMVLGPPLLLALVWGMCVIAPRWRESPYAAAAVIALLVVLVAMDVSGKIRGETSRMWLFLMPVGAAIAGFVGHADELPPHRALSALAIIAALYLLLLRMHFLS